jgi:signal transduction histidine kinase/CheY-like chemotaxis protein
MNKTALLDKFTAVANIVPTPFYCLDLDQQYIGINRPGLAELGLKSNKTDLSSKTPYDFYPRAIAGVLVGYHQEVIRKGKKLAFREPTNPGNNQPCSLTIKPLYDTNNNIVGTSAISIRLTPDKNLSQLTRSSTNKSVFNSLEKLAETIPLPFYWLDLKQRYLGINQSGLQAVNFSNKFDIQGKTPYDLYPLELADSIVAQHKEAINKNKKSIKKLNLENNKVNKKCFNIIVAPLCDSEGNTVGTYSILVDAAKEHQVSGLMLDDEISKKNIFKKLKEIGSVIPVPFYWGDLNHVILGINSVGLKEIGANNSPEKFIGRIAYDVYPREFADQMVRNQRKVISTNKALVAQESIKNITNGKLQHYEAILAPLHDDEGSTIGVYGFSVDITAKKEVKLRREAQQEKFNRVISQAVHDIRSPLAGMLMIVKASVMLPLPIRLALKDAASSINDIAENLLQNWREMDDKETISEDKQAEPVVISLLAMQVIAGKRFQFQDSPVKFRLEIDENSYFSCVQANSSRFKRMFSNLINNAVAAYEGRSGEVTCQLQTHEEQVIVKIKDQGKGIAPEVLDKINQGIQVTSGKQDGQGIGLTQVRDTLELFKGALAIDSAISQGTEMQLSFPLTSVAPWLADSISLNHDDILVIVDDDDSMHQAWQALLKQRGYYQHLYQNIHHFTQGQEAIDYLNGLTDKDKVVLLTDYELLNQPIDGIDVIKQTEINRSIVVTSHYDDKRLREYLDSTDVKILPKQLVHQVSINICLSTS